MAPRLPRQQPGSGEGEGRGEAGARAAQARGWLLRVFHQPAAQAPGSLLEMQSLQPHPGPLESESAF